MNKFILVITGFLEHFIYRYVCINQAMKYFVWYVYSFKDCHIEIYSCMKY